MFKKLTVLFVVSSLCIACSGTIKGPVTGKKYNVNIGCTQDKVKYDRAREEAMGSAEPDRNVVDCPDGGKEIQSY